MNDRTVLLPFSSRHNVAALSRVFKDTSASYKYFWFLALLDAFAPKNAEPKQQADFYELATSMIAHAWYPVNGFMLNLGYNDGITECISKLTKVYRLPAKQGTVNTAELITAGIQEDPQMKKELSFLNKLVPYRFLNPWISEQNNSEMVKRSYSYENGCLYRIEKKNGAMTIVLNPCWADYLQENSDVVRDFVYWNLALYLEGRNPGVPNIASKIILPPVRPALNVQRRYWNTAMRHGLRLRCIYSGKELEVGDYDLDHFIPWNFVAHNQMWNLIPADSSVNSGKSDHIPDFDLYLAKFAETQQDMLNVFMREARSSDSMEAAFKDFIIDYQAMGLNTDGLCTMSRESFRNFVSDTMTPLKLRAGRLGFTAWKYGQLQETGAQGASSSIATTHA